MKKHYDKTENRIAIMLLVVFFIVFVVLMIETLESEELVHGRQASGWYVSTLKSISSTFFTSVVIP